MIYGILGFLLGIVATVIVECIIIRRLVSGNEKRKVKHQTISEGANNLRGKQ